MDWDVGMCGIIAIVGKNIRDIDAANADAILSCLSQRGPDDRGLERLNGCILGQTRLAIIDLSSLGSQPMRDNTHPFTIVFNGEIYGYQVLRAELKARGHHFSSHSDTEVILKAYAEFGRDCVKRLDGMFAFAIWDDEKKELFLARDRFGKKPFYYAIVDGTFIGTSEIKAIFATGLLKGRIDADALDDYLRLMHVLPHRSIYTNIHVLPPAHAGVFKSGTIQKWHYWKLENQQINPTYAEAKTRIRTLFAEAVQKRMVADVEIGSFLSGGVDSTFVTLEAQKHMDRPIKTFSIGYGAHKNELPFAKAASNMIVTDHRTLVAECMNLKALSEVAAYFDEPHADSSNFPQALVSKLASEHVKVALTGDGADELFMGYGWYQQYWHTPLLKRLFSTPFGLYRKTTEVFDTHERAALLKGYHSSSMGAIEKESLRGAQGFNRINDFDLHVYLRGQLLSKIDRTSMMHSLEIRSPFLDTALAEYVYSLPLSFKLSKSENKIILKDILASTFPREFVYRRKQGFGAPIIVWLKDGNTQAKFDSLFNDANHPMWEYISRKAAKAMRVAEEANLKSQGYRLWTLLCLALWFESHARFHE